MPLYLQSLPSLEAQANSEIASPSFFNGHNVFPYRLQGLRLPQVSTGNIAHNCTPPKILHQLSSIKKMRKECIIAFTFSHMTLVKLKTDL